MAGCADSFQTGYLDTNKIFAHLDRICEWVSKGKTKPITIEIDPTNVCNHNCPECAGNRFGSKASLSLEFMKGVIDQVKTFCRGLVFTGGGEPLCNRSTIEAIEYAHKQGLSVGLITNGVSIEKSDCKNLLENCEWIRISVDAANSTDYKKIHCSPEPDFESVWKNISLLVKKKKELKSNCTLGLGYLINRQNKNNVLEFTKKAKRTGVDYVQFRPFHYSGFFPKAALDSAQKFESEKFRVLATMHRFEKEKGSFERCFRDEFTTIITADGKMYPCCFTRGIEKFSFGDLNKSSFDEIWNSKKRETVSKNKLKSKSCPVLCRYDPLNKLLWKIYKANKSGVHLNFV